MPVRTKELQYALIRETLTQEDGEDDLNVDGSSSATAITIWDGTGGADTGGDWTRTGFGTETTGSKHSGTNGLDTGDRDSGETTTFNKGSTLALSGYGSLEFWINVQAFKILSTLDIFWTLANDTLEGNVLLLRSYVSLSVGEWAKVSIPLSEFGTVADVQKLVFRYTGVQKQRHWLDDIVLTGTGGALVFSVAPPATERWHLNKLVIAMGAPSTGWSSSTFANQAALTNGLLIRVRDTSTSQVKWSVNIRKNAYLFGKLDVPHVVHFADGESFLTSHMDFSDTDSFLEGADALEVVVRDDLSAVSFMHSFLHGSKEIL